MLLSPKYFQPDVDLQMDLSIFLDKLCRTRLNIDQYLNLSNRPNTAWRWEKLWRKIRCSRIHRKVHIHILRCSHWLNADPLQKPKIEQSCSQKSMLLVIKNNYGRQCEVGQKLEHKCFKILLKIAAEVNLMHKSTTLVVAMLFLKLWTVLQSTRIMFATGDWAHFLAR